jgi:hemerythrin superfamily protein
MSEDRVIRAFHETIKNLREEIRKLNDDELTELRKRLRKFLK